MAEYEYQKEIPCPACGTMTPRAQSGEAVRCRCGQLVEVKTPNNHFIVAISHEQAEQMLRPVVADEKAVAVG